MGQAGHRPGPGATGSQWPQAPAEAPAPAIALGGAPTEGRKAVEGRTARRRRRPGCRAGARCRECRSRHRLESRLTGTPGRPTRGRTQATRVLDRYRARNRRACGSRYGDPGGHTTGQAAGGWAGPWQTAALAVRRGRQPAARSSPLIPPAARGRGRQPRRHGMTMAGAAAARQPRTVAQPRRAASGSIGEERPGQRRAASRGRGRRPPRAPTR